MNLFIDLEILKRTAEGWLPGFLKKEKKDISLKKVRKRKLTF